MFIKVHENLINSKGKGGGVHNTATTAAMDAVTGGTQTDVAAVDINSIIPKLVSLEAGRMQPEMVTDKGIEVGKQLEEAFGHLQGLLHFARPVEKKTMEAIQVLIEHGAKVQKKNGAPRTDGETLGRAV